MASFTCLVLSFLIVLSISSSFPLKTSSSNTITIPLSFSHLNPNPDLTEELTHLATFSLARSKHIKNPQKNASSSSSNTQLYPHGYGGYSISLNFGTPPQTQSFVMDTGSNFVWFPCTKGYRCNDCNFTGTEKGGAFAPFLPKSSSSARILGCANPKCGWVHRRITLEKRCSECRPPVTRDSCDQICPAYFILYGSGSTGGIALVETLEFPRRKIPNFLVGCSVSSIRQPAGIAGFGRGPVSLPVQLRLDRFSYCLVSHRFDDARRSSSLVMERGRDSGVENRNLSWTPFLKNPQVAGRDALSVYYYVKLKKITVGGVKVRIPYQNLSPDSKGNGGTIVDSGTTFTYLTHDLFEAVASAFVKQVKAYPWAGKLEKVTGLAPCFNVSGHKTVNVPAMKFYFKGGAEMALPLENYFSIVATDAVCLTLVTDHSGQESCSGPSIILGNFQMQNFFVEYDLKNKKLGFRQQLCE
ncbi:unnamed protein product [Cuscuta campestris]|uniref:Peptidase A1 domain-containing protein n=1 Tax=Cuscuta campestris TaxID=132261 RepID=A0A484NDK8_9ASTE|nr:unnamed protein product [Cuscuta campestris]